MILGLFGLLSSLGCGRGDPAHADTKPAATPASVKVRLMGKDGKLGEPVETAKLVLSEEEWKKRLTPEQFQVVRSKGTERPFCGGLLKEKSAGVYACVACALPLFESSSKFESGTGWPSFFQAIAKENVLEETDRSHGMERVEILCARCDGHLGHVFDDGPPPTGRRHCLNSESLRFVAEKDRPTLAEEPVKAAAAPAAPAGKRAEVVLAGGCFWCVEAVFEEIDGVLEAVSGYAGGSAETANYRRVCDGDTDHAEVVKVVYDPDKVSLETILKVHFATHDPTTKNRQGADEGTQYRSAIFFASEEEKALAKAFIADLTEAKAFPRPIVTTLEPLVKFFPAEAYHQNYAACNPGQPYVNAIALPKVAKVREKFKDKIKGAAEAKGSAEAK